MPLGELRGDGVRLIQRRALALDFAVETGVRRIHQQVEAALAALPPADAAPSIVYRCAAGPDGGWSLLAGDTAVPVGYPASVPDLLDALVGHLNLAAIAASRGRLLLHAAAVAAPDGRVALLPGPSGSGKTTLTAALVGAGLAYVTDETLSVHPVTLAITPYRKPLTVKQGSFGALAHLAPLDPSDAEARAWQVPVSRLAGADLPDEPLRVAVVVAPSYRVGDGTQLVPVSTAETVFWLGSNSSSLAAVQPRPLEALARLVRGVPTYRLPYDDLLVARDLVLSLLTPLSPLSPGLVTR